MHTNNLVNNMRIFYTLLIFVLSGCTGIAPGLVPVSNFESDRYLGKWYEIARLDHSFEHGLSDVSANYSMRNDGGIAVVNQGFSVTKNSVDKAEGKAYFVGERTIGHLKVSFFGPFYGSYVVFELDAVDYQYAYVGSYNKDYLWLLSRTSTVTEARKQHFINSAKSKGYAADDLIWVDHSN
jgi:apolipoprotein D and lipocalin family protein